MISNSSTPRVCLPRLCDFLVDQRVPISFAIIMGIISQNVALRIPPHNALNLYDPFSAAGVGLLLGGLGLRSWAAGILRKGKALATTGAYRVCRHPLYLGSLLIMAGFWAIVPDYRNAWILLGPVLTLYWLTMQREETRLARRYGSAWDDYAAEVPRLLPFRPPTSFSAEWSLAQWQRSREYNALFTTLFALAALQMWYVLLAFIGVAS